MDLENILKKAEIDNSEFKEIYEATISRVFPFVLSRTKDREVALEICQDIYTSLWKSLPRFTYISDAHFFSFVFTVARRQIIKARIKRREFVSIDEIMDIPSEEHEKEDYRLLTKSLESLKEKERLVLELRYFSDFSFQEVGEALGIKEGNAKVIHHRAIQKLQTILHDYE
jgi:RNA polymerase sigma-70 factor (ECF subfamily)